MPRSTVLFCVLDKPVVQGVCPLGVCKTLCIAGFFRSLGVIRLSGSRENLNTP